VPHITTVNGHRITPDNHAVKTSLRRATARRLKCVLIERSWSVQELARRARMTRTYASLLIHGRATSRQGQGRIARALGMDVGEAFPQGKVEVEVKGGAGR